MTLTTKQYKNHSKQELENSNNMMTKIINNVPQHIFWKDKNSVFLGCNDNFAKAVGLRNAEDIKGKTEFDLLDPKNAQHFIEEDEVVMSQNEPIYNLVESYKDKQGNTIWININKVPLHDAKGNIIGILGTFQDITKTIDMNKKLKESEKKYRNLIEFTNTSYLIMNFKMQILEANQHFLSLIGKKTFEEVLGKNPRYWVYVNDIQAFDNYFNNLKTKQGNPSFDLEINFVNNEKKQIYVSLACSIMKNGDHKIFCLIRDASYKKMSQQKKYIDRQKKKDKLVQNINQIRKNLNKRLYT